MKAGCDKLREGSGPCIAVKSHAFPVQWPFM